MDNTFTYYDLLGVRSDASRAAIQEAYRASMRHYHPDVNTAPNAQQITAMLNRAYSVLNDPSQRAEYDREIAVGSGRSKPGQSHSADSNPSSGQGFRRSTTTAPVDPLLLAVGWLVPRILGGAAILAVALVIGAILLHVLPFLLVVVLVGVVVRGMLRLIA